MSPSRRGQIQSLQSYTVVVLGTDTSTQKGIDTVSPKLYSCSPRYRHLYTEGDQIQSLQSYTTVVLDTDTSTQKGIDTVSPKLYSCSPRYRHLYTEGIRYSLPKFIQLQSQIQTPLHRSKQKQSPQIYTAVVLGTDTSTQKGNRYSLSKVIQLQSQIQTPLHRREWIQSTQSYTTVVLDTDTSTAGIE